MLAHMVKRAVQIVLLALAAFLAAPAAFAQPAKPAPPPATKKAADNPYNAKHQLDLNSAPKAELVKLPGIGDAYADAIVKNRPYRNKTQLKTKAGVPDATYDQIKEMIIAKQAE
jgi:DNA uptake protein ComE-like DNA-binding protein